MQGVGTVGLCILLGSFKLRHDSVSLTGIDIQSNLIELAQQNAEINGVSDQCKFVCADILTENSTNGLFDNIVMNPPYIKKASFNTSPEKCKATSHFESDGVGLDAWIRYAHRKLARLGYLTLIHRADRLDDVISELKKNAGFGSFVIFPLKWKEGDATADRVVVQARKERYAPLQLRSGLVVHKNLRVDTTALTGERRAYSDHAQAVFDNLEPLWT